MGNANTNPEPRVAILGVGQMGLVCSAILAGARGPIPEITLWGHDEVEVGQLARARGSSRLPGFTIPPSARVIASDADALRGATHVVCAVPAQHVGETFQRLARHLPDTARIISVAKGVEVETLRRPTQVIADALRASGRDHPDRGSRPIGCLSGPTIAAELARNLPAAMIAASDDAVLAREIQSLFTTSWTRIYTNPDVVGVELAGAVKNVVAIAAGILDGLDAGNNAKSALLARGLAEITRLGVAMGASPETFFGIAGVGDLATSCFSPEGRNRSCGEALGKGVRLADHLRRTPHVVEGVDTSRAVHALARKYRVDMPICDAVHAVLFEGLDPVEAIGRLMSREPKPEKIG